MVAVALVVSVASVIFDVANSTFIASVVSREDLTRRNSLMSSADAVTQTAGPSIGGFLVGVLGGAGAIMFDVGSYIGSALLLSRLPCQDVIGAPDHLPVRQAVRGGWRYVVHHPVIGPCAAMATATNFVCGGLLALGPLFLVRTLHTPVALVGVLLSAEGIGTLVGAVATPWLAPRWGQRACCSAPLRSAVCSLC